MVGPSVAHHIYCRGENTENMTRISFSASGQPLPHCSPGQERTRPAGPAGYMVYQLLPC